MNGDRTLTSRFELKYLIPSSDVPALRRYIAPFVHPDPYAAVRPDHTYEISSLYLDTPDLLLCHMTHQGIKNRFKLRIRCYCDDPAAPVFFEVKRRVNKTISKRRARMSRAEACRALTAVFAHDGPGVAATSPEAQDFLGLVAALEARPVCRVRYRREAYEATSGAPLRITFDYAVEHLKTDAFELSMNGPGWRSSGIEPVILEVKYTNAFAPWLGDFVQRFDLAPLSVAKYVLSVERLLPRRASTPLPFPLQPGWSHPLEPWTT